MRVEDGWLVGDNFGEWGGRLWWTDVAGGNARPVTGGGRCIDIADTGPPFFGERPGEPFGVSNTVSLKRAMGRVFAFSGTSHMGVSAGELSRIERRGDRWRSCMVRNLEGAPQAVVADTANSWLALVAGGLFPAERAGALVRVRTDGALLKLAQPAFLGAGSGLFANSMVKLPDATLYVGMRHFVGRLVPMADGSYRDELLLPNDRPPFDFEPMIDALDDRGPSFPWCGVRK